MTRLSLLFRISAILICTGIANASETLTLGVLATQDKTVVEQRFRPVSEYLSSQLSNTRIELKVLGQKELESALFQNELDLLLTDPSHYLVLRSQSSLTGAIATLITTNGHQNTSSMGGVIFTLHDRTIDELAAIRGLRVSTANPNALGSFYAQAYELLKHGINAQNDLDVLPMQTDEAVIQAVLTGRADLGFVRTGTLEALFSTGKIKPEQLNIINQQNLSSFPYTLSTRLYPDWPFIALPHVKDSTLRNISAALFRFNRMPGDNQGSNIAGFSLPADYLPVETLARELRVPPFDIVDDISLSEIWAQYRVVFIITIVLLIVVAVLLVILAIRNRELRSSSTALFHERQRLANIIWGTGVGTWEWNVQTNETIFNERWAEICGYTLEELSPVSLQTWIDLVHPEDLEKSSAALEHHFSGESEEYAVEVRMKHKDGHWVWVLDRGKVVSWTADSKPEWVAGTHLEITRDKLAELALEESESRLRILIERFPGGVMVENADRQVVLTNQEFCDIFGIPMSPRALVGIDCRNSAEQVKELFAEPDAFVHRVEEILNKGRLVLDEIIDMADGRVLERHYIPVHIDDEYSGHVWIYRDITERKIEEAHLQHIAYYDTLTDLPNRSLLSDRMNQAIFQAERRKTFVAIAYIDLDGFKEVNDTLGHKAGDDLLIAVSDRMREILREGDTLARLGGDEFVAVMIDLQDMVSATPLIDRLLEAASQEIETDEKTLTVSASIGLTFYHEDNPLDSDHLLRQADQAMYQAKLSGKNRYALFDPEQAQ